MFDFLKNLWPKEQAIPLATVANTSPPWAEAIAKLEDFREQGGMFSTIKKRPENIEDTGWMANCYSVALGIYNTGNNAFCPGMLASCQTLEHAVPTVTYNQEIIRGINWKDPNIIEGLLQADGLKKEIKPLQVKDYYPIIVFCGACINDPHFIVPNINAKGKISFFDKAGAGITANRPLRHIDTESDFTYIISRPGYDFKEPAVFYTPWERHGKTVQVADPSRRPIYIQRLKYC